MPDPTSQQSEIIEKLATFFAQETALINPQMDWRFYSNNHNPGDSPVGAIYLPKIVPKFQNNFSYYSKSYSIYVRVLASSSDEFELIKSLNQWCGYLLDEPLRKLRKEGYEGFFGMIDVKQATVNPRINQDRGGTGEVLIQCQWDDEAVTTNRYANFA